MINASRFTTLSRLAAMLVFGLLLAAHDTALAGNASGTRDHRGGKEHPGGTGTATQGGITVNGQSTTAAKTKAPKLPSGTTSTTVHGTAGYGGLGPDPSKGKSGIIVRDHR